MFRPLILLCKKLEATDGSERLKKLSSFHFSGDQSSSTFSENEPIIFTHIVTVAIREQFLFKPLSDKTNHENLI